MKFMSGVHMKVAGVDCFVTRSGYTGEDGFEIAFPKEHSETVAQVWRGARDTGAHAPPSRAHGSARPRHTQRGRRPPNGARA